MADYNANALMNWAQPQRRSPMPTEGDNYGYASSMPLNQTPYADAGLGIVQQLGGIGALAATPFQGMAAPLSGLAGLYLLGDGVQRVRRSNDQIQGRHPDQAQMDQYVNALRYYGFDNMRGPR